MNQYGSKWSMDQHEVWIKWSMDKHGVRINIEYRSTCGMDQPGVG